MVKLLYLAGTLGHKSLELNGTISSNYHYATAIYIAAKVHQFNYNLKGRNYYYTK